MKNVLKNFGAVLITIIISFFIFIMFLKAMEYPGGAVGMIPLVLLRSATISLLPTIVIILLLRIKGIVTTNKTLLIFLIAYILISYFYLDIRPFERENSEMDKNIKLWIYFSQFISCGVILMFNKIRKRLFQNT